MLIIGKPNSGKSLLFNRLTGIRQKVANFPGVTVEVRVGESDGEAYADYPGVYSFNAMTRDEEVAIEEFRSALKSEDVSVVLCMIDATRLERSLVIGLQAQVAAKEAGKPIVFALNMMDELRSSKAEIDVAAIEKELGAPCAAISARTEEGLPELKILLKKVKTTPKDYISNQVTESVFEKAKDINSKFGPKAGLILKNQTQLDRFFLSSVFGGISFFFIMTIMFQSIFTWATPLMDLVEESIGWLATFTTGSMADGTFKSFLNDALFGGFGSFLVFVPQIFVLTFIIGLLEDSGYLARAALICHRPLSWFGLSGRSFVPLLSGHACSIPAMFAARTIESPRRRLLTYLAIPLMACSARLPVYSLLVAALIPSVSILGGLVGLQGFVFFLLYFFGIFVALILSAILSKTLYKTKTDSPFIIELPPYRPPHWKPLLLKSLYNSKMFITKAGGIIFAVTVVVWVLGYFPNGDGELGSSYLAQLGQFIEPLFAPLGLDWRYGVAVLMSFLAREVFVGTLGTIFGIENAEENFVGLVDSLNASGFTLASGVALLVFYAIALQCASTLAMMKKELGNWKAPIAVFFSYGILAYVLGWVSYVFVNSLN